MEQPAKRILVVDDDVEIISLVGGILEPAGYSVTPCLSAERALDKLPEQHFDLILADIRLPRMSGIDLLGQVRRLSPGTAVILMTAYPSVHTAVAALRGKAIDYLLKPFGPQELRRRVLLAIESEPREPRPAVEQFGGLVVDRNAWRASVGGHEARLTRREFEVLLYLVERKGCACFEDQLLRDVWSYTGPTEAYAHAVKSCICRLRKKLGEDPRRPRFIENLRGIGYRFIG